VIAQIENSGIQLPATDARPHPRYDIGPISIDSRSQAGFFQGIIEAALTSNTTNVVVPVNAQVYLAARSNPDFRAVVQKAEFVCADGSSIVVACRLLTGKHVDRIPGVDMIEVLCSMGSQHGLRVFLVGGKPGSASDCVKILSERYKGIRMVGSACPDYGFENKPELVQQLIDEIRRAEPKILLVGFGAPKQELFIDRFVRPAGIPVAIAVGGSFEMISGRVMRAPQRIRRAGMEWLYRLMQEPSRLWRRYLIGNSVFIVQVTWLAFKRSLAHVNGRSKVSMDGSTGNAND
jgi:N-acetylglucosaminyldiphosphoundecaprenol N-acetyl-beta-D-mannosaminyltransferase